MASPNEGNDIIAALSNTPKTAQEGSPKAAQTAKPTSEKIAQPTESVKVTSTVDAMNAELKQIELESARLELALKQANLVDMQERLQERELKRANIRQEAYTKGSTLAALAEGKTKNQRRCNHKKGGQGANGVVGGKGDSPDYAILAHTYANGDTWVKCLRCHKTWKPPVESEYIGNQQGFDNAMAAYKIALEFPTKNTPSAGVQFRYSDGGAHYREVTKMVQMG